MRDIFKELYRILSLGNDAMMVSVVASTGSTPRRAGARMVIAEAGRVCGTIGGGMLENRAEQMALEFLKERRSLLHEFSLGASDAAGLGMICGGDATVFFQYFSHDDAAQCELCREIAEQKDDADKTWLMIEFLPGDRWSQWLERDGNPTAGEQSGASHALELARELTGATRRPEMREIDGRTFYTEPLGDPGVVYIFGGGHVTQALVPVLSDVDFSCAVMEDRPAFADKSLFPSAHAVHLGSFADIHATVRISAYDYVVIVTRGHQNDYEVLSQALRTDACYIGMIGSAAKVAATNDRLRAVGFTDKDIARVHTPIGVKILAETPEEIAISIAGELIRVRAEQRKK